MHCNTVLCKMLCPPLRGALQDRLAAGLYHCNYTCEDLMFVQVCSDPTPVQCNTLLGKMLCPQLKGALQVRLAAGLYHSNHTYEYLLFIQVCSDPTPVHCNTVQGKMQCPQLNGALPDRLSAGLYHCNYTCEDLLFIQVCSDPTPVHCNTAELTDGSSVIACLMMSAHLQSQTPPWRTIMGWHFQCPLPIVSPHGPRRGLVHASCHHFSPCF